MPDSGTLTTQESQQSHSAATSNNSLLEEMSFEMENSGIPVLPSVSPKEQSKSNINTNQSNNNSNDNNNNNDNNENENSNENNNENQEYNDENEDITGSNDNLMETKVVDLNSNINKKPPPPAYHPPTHIGDEVQNSGQGSGLCV